MNLVGKVNKLFCRQPLTGILLGSIVSVVAVSHVATCKCESRKSPVKSGPKIGRSRMAVENLSPVLAVTPVPDTAFIRRMMQGHEVRKGHTANFSHVTADHVVWHRVAVCCGEAAPTEVATFDRLVSA